MRLRHLKREPARDHGIEGVSAEFEHAHRRSGRQPMGRGHHAMASNKLRSRRESHLGSKPYHFGSNIGTLS
jgi:hypothetical protein